MRFTSSLLFGLLPLGFAAPLELNELNLEPRSHNTTNSDIVQGSATAQASAATSSAASSPNNPVAGLPTSLEGILGTVVSSVVPVVGGVRRAINPLSERQAGLLDNTPLSSVLNATQLSSLQNANPNSPIPINGATTLGQLAGAGLLGQLGGLGQLSGPLSSGLGPISGLLPIGGLPLRNIVKERQTLPFPLSASTPLSSILNSTQIAQLQAANPAAGITGATTLGQLPASILGQLGALGITGLHLIPRELLADRQGPTLVKDYVTPAQLARLRELYPQSATQPDVGDLTLAELVQLKDVCHVIPSMPCGF